MSVRGRCVNVLTNEKKRDNAHSHSGVRVVNVEVSDNGHVVIGVRIVQCYHAIMDVVIGVCIMQCYHAIFAKSQFPTFGPNYQLVVRLYELIVTFPRSHFLHTVCTAKTCHLTCCAYTPRRSQYTDVSCKRSICNKVIEFKKVMPSRTVLPVLGFISIVTFIGIRSPP